MRKLIDYIRSCFCEHDWEMIYDVCVQRTDVDEIYHCKTYRCKKCGYSKKYKSH